MNTDIWFPFYYGDYLKDTMQLSSERHGIYLLLMIHCWQNGFIEDDIESLSIISKQPIDSISLKYVLDKYFKHEEGKFYQKRITKEKERAEDNKKRRSEKARKAANVRWKDNATSNATSMPEAMLQGMLETCPSSSSSSSQSSLTTTTTTKEKISRFTPPTIEEIKNHCFEKGYNVNPEKFYYHYESNGWKVGKNKMKSWTMALGKWNTESKPIEKKGKEFNEMTAQEKREALDKKFGIKPEDSQWR